jgi:hypothetical protein
MSCRTRLGSSRPATSSDPGSRCIKILRSRQGNRHRKDRRSDQPRHHTFSQVPVLRDEPAHAAHALDPVGNIHSEYFRGPPEWRTPPIEGDLPKNVSWGPNRRGGVQLGFGRRAIKTTRLKANTAVSTYPNASTRRRRAGLAGQERGGDLRRSMCGQRERTFASKRSMCAPLHTTPFGAKTCGLFRRQ